MAFFAYRSFTNGLSIGILPSSSRRYILPPSLFIFCGFTFLFPLSPIEKYIWLLSSKIILLAKGDYNAIINSHDYIIDYINNYECKIIFISSSSVFDGYKNYPNYEFDKTFSKSNFGYLKIKIENKLLKLDENKYTIIRVPFLVGMNSLHIKKIKNEVKLDIPIEVFPNLIINIINIKKITLFIHHIINKKINGIIHLGSKDLIHHVDLIKEILKALKIDSYRLKYVYTTNDNRYIALFNKNKKLPKYLDFKANSIINTIK